ncbi:MAG: phage repressor protein [Thalassolituus sp. CG17_big_fil_post_rev_8_21_14_2_50_53_8]|jgi:hypothetical protein|nr:MAG: phage repressor protein [Thalassolituus sp. CG17_big_fil_post_rev_8_21_14_2_50_53_8]
MDTKSAEAVINRLKRALHVDSDAELCRVTGVNKQTLSNWKARNSVPYPLCVQISEEREVSLDWLLTGSGPLHRGAAPETGQVVEESATYMSTRERALLDLFKELSEEDQREICRDAEEKKRMRNLEAQLQEVQAALAVLKKSG